MSDDPFFEMQDLIWRIDQALESDGSAWDIIKEMQEMMDEYWNKAREGA